MRVQHEVTNALADVVSEYHGDYAVSEYHEDYAVVTECGSFEVWLKSECVDVTHIPMAEYDSLHPDGF